MSRLFPYMKRVFWGAFLRDLATVTFCETNRVTCIAPSLKRANEPSRETGHWLHGQLAKRCSTRTRGSRSPKRLYSMRYGSSPL